MQNKSIAREDGRLTSSFTARVVAAFGTLALTLAPTTPSADAAGGSGRFLNPLPAGTGNVTSYFGGRVNPINDEQEHHDGIDVAAPAGTTVSAPANGHVVRAEGIDKKRPHYGTILQLDHGDGLTTYFAHLGQLRVEVGQEVSRGDVIALVGTSGQSTGPHIHFEVREDGQLVDPALYIPEWKAQPRN